MRIDEAEKSSRTQSRYAETEKRSSSAEYDEAEESFAELRKVDCLDDYVRNHPSAVGLFECALQKALNSAYPTATDAANFHSSQADNCARLFLQRVLYQINRLKLFWFDDLRNYDNERSDYLCQLRDRIERAWQAWELSMLNLAALRREKVRDGLLRRAALDVSPPASASGLYFRHHVGRVGYRRLLAIASLDGLVEASQLSRTLGGVSNDIHSMLTRLMVEEYGGGRL
ncbi:MAG TPA: iron-containing redox enzyme family protein, partial [Candidatus Binatia bacterium]